MKRQLLTVRRTVPLDQHEEYNAAWEALRRQVEREGGRAWRFRGADRMDHFIEFLEWRAQGEPERTAAEGVAVADADSGREGAAVADVDSWREAAARLDTEYGAGTAEEWVEG